MKTSSLIIFLPLLASSLRGQLVGAFETFTNEANAKSWNLYDESTGVEGEPPFWTLPGSEADPEIYGEFFQNFSISLYANSSSSDAYLVGDYVAAGVAGVFTNVFVEDHTSFDSFEFYIVSNGIFYYSNYFEVDFSGWSSAENSFRDSDWYIGVDTNDDGFVDEFIYTPLTDEILGNVSEVGLNFYPNSVDADGTVVGLDNFTLLADLTPPTPILEVGPDSGSYSFTALPGTLYTVEQSDTIQAADWDEVEPPFEGTGAPYSHEFTTGPRNFFRLLIEVLYTEIPEVSP